MTARVLITVMNQLVTLLKTRVIIDPVPVSVTMYRFILEEKINVIAIVTVSKS